VCDQVLPASVDLYAPFPISIFGRMLGSPVPAQTTLGSERETANAPIEATI
jgi:hypothetical protein